MTMETGIKYWVETLGYKSLYGPFKNPANAKSWAKKSEAMVGVQFKVVMRDHDIEKKVMK